VKAWRITHIEVIDGVKLVRQTGGYQKNLIKGPYIPACLYNVAIGAHDCSAWK
jgi:hypothetical protein